jgi:hypothetical protein
VAVIKPRTKVVFFRVSEEEFQEIEQACGRLDARSLSDFVRLAVQRLMTARDEERVQTLAESLDQLEKGLDQLKMKIERLNECNCGAAN